MKKILSSGNFQIIKRGVSLVVVLTMLVVSIVFVAPNLSFGWFTENKEVTASGMHTQAYHSKFKVYYQLPANGIYSQNNFTEITVGQVLPVLGELKAPGDVVEFQIKIESVGTRPITLNGFGLEAPTIREEMARAYDSDGDGVTEAHYLSTEIKTKLLAVNDTAVTMSEVFLRENNTSPRIDFFEKSNLSGIVLEKGESVVFTVQLSFINRPNISQNQFKNFAQYGVCARRLFFSYDE